MPMMKVNEQGRVQIMLQTPLLLVLLENMTITCIIKHRTPYFSLIMDWSWRSWYDLLLTSCCPYCIVGLLDLHHFSDMHFTGLHGVVIAATPKRNSAATYYAYRVLIPHYHFGSDVMWKQCLLICICVICDQVNAMDADVEKVLLSCDLTTNVLVKW